MTKRFNRSSILMALLSVVLPFSIASAKPAKPAKAPVKTEAKATVKKSAKSTAKTAEKKASSSARKEKSKARKAEKDRDDEARTSKKNADRKASRRGKRDADDKKETNSRKRAAEDRKSQKKKATAEKTVSMPVRTLRAGGTSIRAEVASTEAQHEKGLMYRKSLPANNGMLFDFKSPAKTCMWMKNTYIPLSVAFIDVNGKVVNIEEMKAMTTTTHCSKDWIRYALEMNAKWFSKHGVKPGSKITGLPR